MHSQLGVALVWLGEGEEAEEYLKKALKEADDRQVIHAFKHVLEFYRDKGEV